MNADAPASGFSLGLIIDREALIGCSARMIDSSG